jgi:hypothetical protein
MKQLTLILTHILFIGLTVSAQSINSLQIFPVNPTTNDSVIFIGDVTFSSGTCNSKVLNHSLNSNMIYTNAIHCVGPLTYICYDSDTFNLGLLSQGNYTLYYQVDVGNAPSPCTPGIVAGPIDSIQFSVNLASGVDQLNSKEISVGPNPANSFLDLNFKKAGNISKTISVFSLDGRLLKEIVTNQNFERVDVKEYQDGVYLLSVLTTDNYIFHYKFVKQ